MRTKLQLTADGSHTLFVPELDEHYHSVNGAKQESRHVFINTGLQHVHKSDIRIFEVGFGTGLNAILTLLESLQSNKKIHYTTIEAYPLSIEITNQLNYTNELSTSEALYFNQLHQATWNKDVSITESFTLKKIEGDFTQMIFSDFDLIDLIYFDAFAPDKQSDMWTQSLFDKLYNITSIGGILVTYCAKGVVRRMLQQAGYTVERLPGPPGKREMLRAIKHS